MKKIFSIDSDVLCFKDSFSHNGIDIFLNDEKFYRLNVDGKYAVLNKDEEVEYLEIEGNYFVGISAYFRNKHYNVIKPMPVLNYVLSILFFISNILIINIPTFYVIKHILFSVPFGLLFSLLCSFLILYSSRHSNKKIIRMLICIFLFLLFIGMFIALTFWWMKNYNLI